MMACEAYHELKKKIGEIVDAVDAGEYTDSDFTLVIKELRKLCSG